MTIRSLPAFLLISFGIAWGISALYIFNQTRMTVLFGPISGTHPLFILAVYSPAIAAITVVLWSGGIQGLRRYLSRMFLWRCSSYWYAFVIFGIPLIYFTGAVAKGNLFATPLPFATPRQALAAMAFMLVLGPVEELGWRGIALPLIQRHLAPVWAGLILGVIWGIWHLPAFYLSGTPRALGALHHS